ncbi:MAG: hypothetical protein Q9165_008897, partial [Trypethelium subeluteriae]
YEAGNPGASTHNILSLQDFMVWTVSGMQGRKGDDWYFNQPTSEDESNGDDEGDKVLKPVYQSARNSWNNFCGWCARMNHPISDENKELMTTHNKRFQSELRTSAREAKFASDFHYERLADSNFRRYPNPYCKPRVGIDQWAISTITFFASGRVGEIARSSAREDSKRENRGLHYKVKYDVIWQILLLTWNFKGAQMFAMFHKSKKKTVLCIKVTKDEKGKGNTPEDRGQITLSEDQDGPLYANGFLFCLVPQLAKNPFRDYRSEDGIQLLKQLLEIEVTKEQRLSELFWTNDFKNKPFFEPLSDESGKVEEARAVHRRHRESCYRAGFPKAPSFHDFRRAGLTNADSKHSESSRMRLGGQTTRNMFRQHYQPREIIDGSANFLGLKENTDVLEISRTLNIPYTPNLLQSLPAKELHEFRQSLKYQVLRKEIDEETSIQKRGKLQRKLESLKLKRLKSLRALQVYNDQPRYEHEIYSRVKFMVPEWCRLEKNLFEHVPLRSPIGMQVIKDLYALYIRDKEVEFRPGLEPEFCSCPRKNDSYHWRHIFTCRKATLAAIHSQSEFCFLCSLWVNGKTSWEEHCQDHIHNITKFPVWVDPLMFQNVLAVAGFCEFCLIDPRLPASIRMQQFTWRQPWLDHYQAHYRDPKFEPKCRHGSWESLQELQYHLHDCHGVEFPDASKQCKRRKREQEEPEPTPSNSKKRQRRCRDKGMGAGLQFHNSTADSMALSLASAKLPSLEPDFDKAQISQPKSDYPDITLDNLTPDVGPYFCTNTVPKSELSETRYPDIDDILVDFTEEPGSNFNTKEVNEQKQPWIIDLTGMESDIVDDQRRTLSNCDIPFDIDKSESSSLSSECSPPDIDNTPTFNTSLRYNNPNCHNLTSNPSLSLDPNGLKENLINEVDPCLVESEILAETDLDTPPQSLSGNGSFQNASAKEDGIQSVTIIPPDSERESHLMTAQRDEGFRLTDLIDEQEQAAQSKSSVAPIHDEVEIWRFSGCTIQKL